MTTDKRKRLYDSLVAEGYDLPDYEAFSTDMANEANRKSLHANLISEGYELPDFDTFTVDIMGGPDQLERPEMQPAGQESAAAPQIPFDQAPSTSQPTSVGGGSPLKQPSVAGASPSQSANISIFPAGTEKAAMSIGQAGAAQGPNGAALPTYDEVQKARNVMHDMRSDFTPGAVQSKREAKLVLDAAGYTSYQQADESLGEFTARQEELRRQREESRAKESYYQVQWGMLTPQEFAKKKLDLEAKRVAASQMIGQVNQMVAEYNARFGNQIELTTQQEVDRYNSEMTAAQARIKSMSDSVDALVGYVDNNTELAAMKEYELQAQKGSKVAALTRQTLEGTGEAAAGLFRFMHMVRSLPIDLYESVTGDEVSTWSKAMMGVAPNEKAKEDFLAMIQEAPVKLTGIDDAVTKEYMTEWGKTTSGEVLLAAADMLPAMAAAATGNPTVMAGYFFTSSYNDAMKQMDGEQWEDVPQWKKEVVGNILGVVSAGITSTGAQAMAGKIPFVRDLTASILGKIAPGMSAAQIRRIADAETSSFLANVASRTLQGSLVEGVTEPLDYMSEEAVKYTYEWLESNPKMFENAQTWSDLADGVLDNARVGFGVGVLYGGAFSAVGSIGSGKRLTNKQYEWVERLTLDGSLEDKYKQDMAGLIATGKATQGELDKGLDDIAFAKKAMEMMPDDLPVESRREAFDLIREKMALSKKDKNLVGDKIAAIDRKLQELAGVKTEEPVVKSSENLQPETTETTTGTTAEDATTETTETPAVEPISAMQGSGLAQGRSELSMVLEQAKNAEYINENKLAEAENELYEIASDIEGRQDLSPEQKEQMMAVVEGAIQTVQDYGLRTRTETRTTTQEVAGRVPSQTKRAPGRGATPIAAAAESGVRVSLDDGISGPKKGVIRKENGQYVFHQDPMGAVKKFRPVVLGDAALVDGRIKFIGMENPSSGSIVSVAKIQTPDGKTLSILDDDLSIDVGIHMSKQQLGPVPQEEFDVVFDQIVSENQVEVPYIYEPRPRPAPAPAQQAQSGSAGPRVTSFTTSRGSTYEVNGDGQTTRTKRSEGRGKGETYPPHNVLFVSSQDATDIIDELRAGATYRFVVEDQDSPTGARSIREGESLRGRRVALGLFAKDGSLIRYVPGKTTPEVGLHPVELRYETRGGQRVSMRHVGNAIASISTDQQAQEATQAPGQSQVAPEAQGDANAAPQATAPQGQQAQGDAAQGQAAETTEQQAPADERAKKIAEARERRRQAMNNLGVEFDENTNQADEEYGKGLLSIITTIGRMTDRRAKAVLKLIAPGVKIIRHKTQESLDAAQPEGEKGVDGFWIPSKKEIHIGPKKISSLTQILGHEMMHPVFDQFIGASEGRIGQLYDELLQHPHGKWFAEFGKQYLNKKNLLDPEGQLMAKEEAIVEFLGAVADGKYDKELLDNKFVQFFKDLLVRAMKFIKMDTSIDISNVETLKDLAAAVATATRYRRALKFTEKDAEVDAFGNVKNSRGVDQAFDGPETPKTPIGDTKTVMVDGKERTVFNSEGRPIHPTVEGVRNFWRWFGDSKVVDAEGRPLVVYHSTGAWGIESFRTPAYFAAERSYANAIRPNLEMYEAYLKIDRPLDLRSYSRESMAAGARGGIFGGDNFQLDKWNVDEWGKPAAWGVQLLDSERAGLRDMPQRFRDDMAAADGAVGEDAGSDGDISYVVFSPTQIKSATGNYGAFDPSNPDIRFSKGGKQVTPEKVMDGALDAMQQNANPSLTDDQLIAIGLNYLKSTSWYASAPAQVKADAIAEVENEAKDILGIKASPTSVSKGQTKLVQGALANQILSEADAATAYAAKDFKAAKKEFIRRIKEAFGDPKKKLNTEQQQALVDRASKVNIRDLDSIIRFSKYAERVMSDASFAGREKTVRAMQKRARRRKIVGQRSDVMAFTSVPIELLPDDMFNDYMDALNDLTASAPNPSKMQSIYADVMRLTDSVGRKKTVPEPSQIEESAIEVSMMPISNIDEYRAASKKAKRVRGDIRKALEANSIDQDKADELYDMVGRGMSEFEELNKAEVDSLRESMTGHILGAIRSMYDGASENFTSAEMALVEKLARLRPGDIEMLTTDELSMLSDIVEMMESDNYMDAYRLAPLIDKASGRYDAMQLVEQILKARDPSTSKALDVDKTGKVLDRSPASAFAEYLIGLSNSKTGAFYRTMIHPISSALKNARVMVSGAREKLLETRKKYKMKEHNLDRVGMFVHYLREYALTFDPRFDDIDKKTGIRFGARDWFGISLEQGWEGKGNAERKRMQAAWDSLPRTKDGMVDPRAVYESFVARDSKFLTKNEMAYMLEMMDWMHSNLTDKQRLSNLMNGKEFESIPFHIHRHDLFRKSNIDADVSMSPGARKVRLSSDVGKEVSNYDVRPIVFNFEELANRTADHVSREYYVRPAINKFNAVTAAARAIIGKGDTSIIRVAEENAAAMLNHEFSVPAKTRFDKASDNLLKAKAMTIFVRPARVLAEYISSLSYVWRAGVPLRGGMAVAKRVPGIAGRAVVNPIIGTINWMGRNADAAIYRATGKDIAWNDIQKFSSGKDVENFMQMTGSLFSNKELLNKHYEISGRGVDVERWYNRLAAEMASAPERNFLQPVWMAKFKREFFLASGVALDQKRFMSDPNYRIQYSREVEIAVAATDAITEKIVGATTKGAGKRKQNLILDDIDTSTTLGRIGSWMTGYPHREWLQMVSAIRGLGPGSSGSERALSSSVIVGSVWGVLSYNFLMQAMYIGERMLTGDDEEKEEAKKELERLMSWRGMAEEGATAMASLTMSKYGAAGRVILRSASSLAVFIAQENADASTGEDKKRYQEYADFAARMGKNATYFDPIELNTKQGAMAAIVDAVAPASILSESLYKVGRMYSKSDIPEKLSRAGTWQEKINAFTDDEKDLLVLQALAVNAVNLVGGAAFGFNVPYFTKVWNREANKAIKAESGGRRRARVKY